MDYYINVHLALALIYAFYHLVLKRSAYFSANRAFLLSGLGLAFLIPALSLHLGSFSGIFTQFSIPETFLQEGSPIGKGGMPPVVLDPVSIVGEQPASFSLTALSSLTIWQWVTIAYCCITCLLLLKIVIFVYQILRLYRKNSVIKCDGYRLVLLENSREPAFSFFSIIFINSKDLHRADKWILRHELVHVRHLHSLDILLSEVVKALLWINPFVYLYQRELRSVNEYMADAIVSQEEKSRYARLMYDYSFRGSTLSLKNSFFNKTLLKRRINMLYQKKTRKMRIAYLLVIPLLALLLAFSSSETQKPLNPAAEKSGTPENNGTAPRLITVSGTVTDLMNETIAGASIFVKGTPHGTATDLKGYFELRNIPSDAQLQFSMIGYETELITLRNNRTVNIRLQRKREQLNKLNITAYVSSTGKEKKDKPAPELFQKPEGPVHSFASLEKKPSFPGGNEKLISYIAKRYRYPADARENKVEGLVEIGFVVDKEGNVTKPEILKGIGSGCDEEALRVINTLPQWEPGEQNGVKVAVYYVLPLNLNLNIVGE